MGEILGREIPGAEAVNLDAWEAELARHLEGLGADAAAPARLARYHRLLCEWNARMNLTGDTDFAVALYRHYLDSLAPLRLEGLFAHGARVIDVGSGAGFPGLPLAIVRPDLQVTLLDALQKRISFLAAVVEELGLTHVRLVHARAETARAIRNTASATTWPWRGRWLRCRCCASMCCPLWRWRRMLCYKGPRPRRTSWRREAGPAGCWEAAHWRCCGRRSGAAGLAAHHRRLPQEGKNRSTISPKSRHTRPCSAGNGEYKK